jgi:hypothetical protein
MRLARTARIKGEGAVGLLVIVLLLAGGIVWWLYSSRQDAQQSARSFATEIAKRVAVDYDEKFLHVHLSPDAQKTYLRSARDRLLERLREFGTVTQPIEVQGDVVFTRYFFDPHGQFHAQLKYPAASAQLDLDISRGMTVWQVDAITLTGTPPTAATPAPAPVASPTPTPTPEPAQQSRRKRKG